jgi:hypothetical protein
VSHPAADAALGKGACRAVIRHIRSHCNIASATLGL